jgi:UDPglucose 6-dehydrogenase
MRIGIVGTGYVGLVTGACFAHLGHEVACVDVVKAKVEAINRGHVPIYEPGLEEMLAEQLRLGRIRATLDYQDLQGSDIVFLCVGTPSRKDGSLDLGYLRLAAKQTGVALRRETFPLIVVKSTVMPRTTQDIIRPILERQLQGMAGSRFGLAMNPEFLKEGAAVQDFLHPDRIVIGSSDPVSTERLKELYSQFQCPIMVTDTPTAEMVKVASNAFLATKISFVNEVGNVSKALRIDFRQVAEGMGHDARIGKLFLRAGCGYGGSCFPKDLEGLIAVSRRYDEEVPLLQAVRQVNRLQPGRMVRLLERHIDVKGSTIAVLGLAFKPETDDVREASSQRVVRQLLRKGAKVKAYDPKAIDNFRPLFPEVDYCPDAASCVSGADAVLVLTEWKEFSDPALYGERLVVDGRGIVRTQNYEGICW